METNRHVSSNLRIPDLTAGNSNGSGDGSGNVNNHLEATGYAEHMNGGSYFPNYCYPAYPPPGAFAASYGPAVFMGVQPMYMAPMMGVPYFVAPADPSTHSVRCKSDAIPMPRESRKALLARRRVHTEINKHQPRRPRPEGGDILPAHAPAPAHALARGGAAVLTGATKQERVTEHRAENQAPIASAGPGQWDQRLDIKDLMLLLAKQLSPSGVSSLGRIVLPKKEAEAHMPHLVASEGLLLTMADFDTRQSWTFRYRFWSNNKSRMYLLENTRGFVKAHNLQERDMFFLYKDAQGSYVRDVPSLSTTDCFINHLTISNVVVRGEKHGRNQACDHIPGGGDGGVVVVAAEEVSTSEEISRKNQTFEFLV